ncbi:mitotic spindle assembly checkpoint protein MAD1 isoform X3 [Daktulosphaira vitifoliae]|uniref:mitotic spindle assembly checkpoint protein MAD1 isoform X3 n=1 Tax=Daktulosphaira vitifoliae TaxID=58002 RepID=UPI0021AAF581|nr:mitotic spindle assembly checkpoint protein MAD1 isoform X3 [Daktulosphaira vitifoliae]
MDNEKPMGSSWSTINHNSENIIQPDLLCHHNITTDPHQISNLNLDKLVKNHSDSCIQIKLFEEECALLTNNLQSVHLTRDNPTSINLPSRSRRLVPINNRTEDYSYESSSDSEFSDNTDKFLNIDLETRTIPELTAEEELKEERNWRSCSIHSYYQYTIPRDCTSKKLLLLNMNKPKDDDQTFVIKILDDLRSTNNRSKPLRMHYDTSIGLSTNDSLLSNKRRRSCSPDLQESMLTPVTSPWESRRIKQELISARAEIASLQERNKTLFNLKKESDLLFEREKNALEHNINKSKFMIEQLDNRLKELRHEKLSLKDENDNLSKKLDMVLEENNIKISKIEKENKELETKLNNSLENELALLHENSMIVNSQREKLKRFSSMESELISLRGEVAIYRNDVKQTEILENKVATLENKLVKYELLEKEAIELRSNLAICEDRLKKWIDVCQDCCENISESQCYPEYLRYYVENLKKKEMFLVNEKGELQSSLARLELKIKQIENDFIKMKDQLTVAGNNSSKLEGTIKRLKKQLYMVTWERNDLRELIDSFQKEVTVIGNLNGEDTKMEVLEKAITGYKNRMTEIETDPSLYCPTDNDKRWIEEKTALLKEKEELINKCKQLEEKCVDLRDQIDHRALKGDFNLRETKVLHFKMNPASEGFNNYQNDLLQAKQEIEKLKERIKAMQEGISMNLTQVVDDRVETNASQEVEGLKEKLKSQEIQNQRLREVFKKSSQEFRESVYTLLGYKVDGLQNNMYRLTSQFAFHEEDNLLFQLNEGSMNLLETSFSKTIEEMINIHLGQQRSIPVLLSSLTIDLFSKQSMVMTADSTRLESAIN